MVNFKRSVKLFLILCFVFIFVSSFSIQAKRTIYGKITSSKGNKPVAGAVVKAYDSDPGSDQRMGKATTNSRGEYRIKYRDGAWDGKKTKRHTSWRPDIYIVVVAPEHHQGKSKKYNNQKLKNDRKINLKLRYMEGARTIQGRVMDSSGRAVKGALVTACDSDVGKDQRMGTARTSGNGNYKITYRSGSWDGAKTDGHTQWRPDIYIVVHKDDFHKFKSPKVYKDHKLAKKLVINVLLSSKSGVKFPSNKDMCNYKKYAGGTCPKNKNFKTTGGWKGCKCPKGYYKHYIDDLKLIAVCISNPCFMGEKPGCSTPHVGKALSWKWDKTFHKACVRHDLCYRNGYATYHKSRKNCDVDFLSDMNKLCNKKLVALRPPCYAAAIAYYKGVRKGGKSSFRTKNSHICYYETKYKHLFAK
ncbi:MAG: phospholipase A2 [Acidobacteriota bacterium]